MDCFSVSVNSFFPVNIANELSMELCENAKITLSLRLNQSVSPRFHE